MELIRYNRFLTKSLVRSYKRSFNGFAAYLTDQEQEKLAGHEKVVSIFPSTTFYPQTTRSWDFLGLAENVHRNPTVESDTIIGVIDTGIWPESESFNDEGFGPPPKRWKGVCKGGNNFTCNNKLIGARYYNSQSPTVDSARDKDGHGSHTASIAAGNYVKDASFYGIAQGTARGGVPSARIAAYKACNGDGCQTTDLLAAFDDAIADGVDIITISVGGDYPSQLENDVIAIGSLHAFQKGILVTQSAGNRGRVSSVMPWIFTVGASSTDRGIVTKVAIGNGTIFTGKIVLCSLFGGVKEAFRAGALGSVASQRLFFQSPAVADESSVVPLSIPSCPKLLQLHKPDITAPGIEILAAYSPIGSPSFNPSDKRSVNYSILSGTSMSCPHVAGAAAYVKSFHPNWSPSAIKSALMTTAWKMDRTKDSLAEFSYGAGHIDPVKAVDPGLVYETFTDDYIKMFCGLGYDSAKLSKIFGVDITCPAGQHGRSKDLNYPSMTSYINTSVTFSENFTRTVTNVGLANSTYKVTTSTSPDYNITVTPNVLTFGATNEKKSFEVIISWKTNNGKLVSASLEWSDGVRKVRSPIVVYPNNL
ncbi:hypothetical protein DH2020_026979 [Rehmannia glutinosa]|uniref:Uncharacterized protein n=1 Tax=Rehmannia glutinosa TaxID=99300 RepID=A0ABR0VXW2_REHGL